MILDKKQLRCLFPMNKIVVSTNGCFDLIHKGHIDFLRDCRKYGDVLVVGLNSDKSIKRMVEQGRKESGRPIKDERSRAEIIDMMRFVDFVYVFDEPDPCMFLNIVMPSVHIKAADYAMDQIIEKDTVESNGGVIELIDYTVGYSTTKIIDKIRGG